MAEPASAPRNRTLPPPPVFKPCAPAEDQGVRVRLMGFIMIGILASSAVLYLMLRTDGSTDTTAANMRTWQEPKQRHMLYKDTISEVWDSQRMMFLLRNARELFNIREFSNDETRQFLRAFATTLDKDTPLVERALTQKCIESKFYEEDTCYMRTYLYILHRSKYEAVDIIDRMASFPFARQEVMLR